jgi:hypothetical protein
MANGTIAIDEPSVVDKLLDTTELTVGANTVERERVVIAGAAATDLCPVDATKGLRVDLTNTGANSTALKVDGSTVTQPVSGSVTAIPGKATSGGFSNSSINSAASNNATAVKGSAGQVYGVHIYNNASYPIYVKFYDKATAPAPGTDNALLVRRIGVQAGVHRDVVFAAGLPFANGIGLAIVKGITDTDNTSVAANDCLVETEYA